MLHARINVTYTKEGRKENIAAYIKLNLAENVTFHLAFFQADRRGFKIVI